MAAELTTATATVVDTAVGTHVPPAARGRVDRLTDDAVAVTFDVPPSCATAYRFTAGQHVNVRTDVGGEEVRRSYSICAPATGQRLRVAVKRLDGGAFSAFAHDAAAHR